MNNIFRSLANVAITVRRKIIKSIEVSIEESGEDSSEHGNKNKHAMEKNRQKQVGRQQDSSTGNSPGTTGVARPFISDTSSPTSFDKQSKTIHSSTDILNPNLFKEKSVSLEMYENIRAPSKILDLRTLLINENEDNIIFEMVENKYEMFEVDQLSGKFNFDKFQ